MYYNENIVTNNEDVDSADILVTYNPFRTLDINKMENFISAICKKCTIDSSKNCAVPLKCLF